MTTPNDRPPLAAPIVFGLAAASLIAHVLVSALGPYGIHRDAYLYMAMGEHLRLWKMDFPPLIAIVSRTVRAIAGDSIVALRLVPATASAALIVVAGLSARELGGRWFAQALAGLGVLAGVVYLRSAALFQPVALDQLWWTLGLFSLLALCRSEDPRWWLGFGLAAGLGLLTKFSILIFGAGVLIALVLTPARTWLGTRWPWLAALVALLIGSPSLVGQVNLGFPVLGQIGDLQTAQLDRVTPIAFLVEQPMMAPGALLGGLGAIALLVRPAWRRYRFVGAAGLAPFLLLLALGGKAYYAAPLYPVLIGAGAAFLQSIEVRPWGGLVRRGTACLFLAYLVLLLPLGLPILPPAAMEDYQVRLGLQARATATNVGGQERIPQDYADMLGWEELVAEVARAYRELPDGDRERAVILTSNYGEAGAIDFHGPALGLPPARSFVGSYWFFGPGELPGEVLLLVGFRADELSGHCADVEAVGRIDHPYAVAEQRDQTLHLCRSPAGTLREFWPTVRGAN